jgi:6-phosphogluconolactonase
MKPAFGTLRVYEDATALAQAGADYLCDLTSGNPSRMIIALSGGNTPKPLYEHLAEEPIKSRLPWNRVHFILGDERFVPPSDPASNFGMASSAFLAHVPIPPQNVHPVETQGTTLEKAAENYEAMLKRLYGSDRLRADCPLLDLALLGLGEDGHTASLIPGQPVLEERERWVAPVPQGRKEPRITLTYRALDSSSVVAFLVSGEGKREIFDRILSGDSMLPASRIRPVGEVIWFTDRAAAGRWG